MSFTIYLGGLQGVAAAVEHYCARRGHQCVLYLPPCHPRAKFITPLTPTDLKNARTHVLAAVFRLQCSFSSPLSEQYLCCHWHIVKDKHVHGEPGWCVDMAKALNKPVYVFELNAELWYWWNKEDQQFQSQDYMSDRWIQPPTLQDKTAIVGTREPPRGSLVELQRLFSLSLV